MISSRNDLSQYFMMNVKWPTTNVIGKADTVTFKTTGKEILEKGWRVVFERPDASTKKESGILPTFY